MNREGGHDPTDRAPHGRLARLFWTGLDGTLAVLLAASCAACRRTLETPTAGPVCRACWLRIERVTPPVCEPCGAPLPSWRVISCARVLCPRCRRTRSALDRARAVGAYDGSLRDIIHAFKYDGRRTLGRPLARLMRDTAGDLLDDVSFIVPVPLHPARRRARGFNQALDLARHLDRPVWPLLRRTRNTPSQTDLPAAQRHRNVRDAFAVRKPWRGWTGRSRAAGGGLEAACVLLVDDVSTTGATLEACARALKAAGAGEVRALTVARVLARPWR